MVPSQETKLSIEESEAAGDGVETEVAQGASLEKILMLGGIGGRRRRGQQRMR